MITVTGHEYIISATNLRVLGCRSGRNSIAVIGLTWNWFWAHSSPYVDIASPFLPSGSKIFIIMMSMAHQYFSLTAVLTFKRSNVLALSLGTVQIRYVNRVITTEEIVLLDVRRILRSRVGRELLKKRTTIQCGSRPKARGGGANRTFRASF
jgi:hypothetical protein